MKFLDIKMGQDECLEHMESLSNWSKLSSTLNDLTEDELERLIYVEAITLHRLHMLNRLKSRFNKLRNERENTLIINICNKINKLHE